jgi:hypothetical protein
MGVGVAATVCSLVITAGGPWAARPLSGTSDSSNPPSGRSLLARRNPGFPGVVIAAQNLCVPAVPLERDPIPVLTSRRDVIGLSRRTQQAVKARPSPATPQDKLLSALPARSRGCCRFSQCLRRCFDFASFFRRRLGPGR